MYDFFKNIANKNSCSFQGVCSIHPTVNALHQLLLSEVKQIAFYTVKLKEFGIENKEILSLSIDTLSIFLINTSFSDKSYLELFKKIYNAKNEIKEKYITYCSDKEFPCEIINPKKDEIKDCSISKLIQYAQNNIINNNYEDKIKRNLFELVSFFARITALNIIKIKKNSEEYQNFEKDSFEVLRFFALTNSYSNSKEKLIRRIKEFSKIARQIKEMLYSTYVSRYGKKQDAKINFNILKGSSILVSGDDFDELDNLIKAIEASESEINVYTNGPLFLAHFYPYFKNNKFLKGHFGKDNAEYDFSLFPGAVLITRNFIQKIDNLYKGEIFSNKLISFSKVIDIENNDYFPLIETSLKLKNDNILLNKTSSVINYNLDKILSQIEELKDKEVIIILGKNQNVEKTDIKVISLDFPIENDILYEAIKKIKEKNIKITLFFSECNINSIEDILLFLDSDIDLNIGKCSDFLINPHVVEVLENEFNVKFI